MFVKLFMVPQVGVAVAPAAELILPTMTERHAALNTSDAADQPPSPALS